MNFQSYLNEFTQILESKNPVTPYDDPAFVEYVKLNFSRLNRWIKSGVLSEEIKQIVSEIKEPQNWIVITEPWCGDAAHIVPFFHMIAELNTKIHVDYELRDSEPHTINNYLTNGGKAIPILIVRNEAGKDIFIWGPRPVNAQNFFLDLKNKGVEMDEIKPALQQWYNKDKGQSLQEELCSLLSKDNSSTEVSTS